MGKTNRVEVMGNDMVMRALLLAAAVAFSMSCHAGKDVPMDLYLLIGQSNMAGRGSVEEQDRIPHPRVFTLSKGNQWVPAMDPIHFDKLAVAGVGPGRTFGIKMAENDPSACIGLIPCAVGGSSIRTWQPGALDKKTGIHPYDDMLARLHIALTNGTLKGILWHQGGADTAMGEDGTYEQALTELIIRLRMECHNPDLPFIIGQLGQFEKRPWSDGRVKVDQAHRKVAEQLPNCAFVSSRGLKDKGDLIHFNAESARELGKRYAEAMNELVKH